MKEEEWWVDDGEEVEKGLDEEQWDEEKKKGEGGWVWLLPMKDGTAKRFKKKMNLRHQE